ncbi:MAG: SUMF1/EgtB/PvdO family nonheme iron enzyme [Candidatus Omnitrophota bacterium]
MDKILEIASNISTPLGIAGIIACFLSFIIKIIISKPIFPKLSRTGAFDTFKLSIDRLFYLSIIAVVLGFLGYALKLYFVEAPKSKSEIVFSELKEKLGIFKENLDSFKEETNQKFDAQKEEANKKYDVLKNEDTSLKNENTSLKNNLASFKEVTNQKFDAQKEEANKKYDVLKNEDTSLKNENTSLKNNLASFKEETNQKFDAQIEETTKKYESLKSENSSLKQEISYVKRQVNLIISHQRSQLKPPSDEARKLSKQIPDDASPYELALKAIAEERYIDAKALLEKAEREINKDAQKNFFTLIPPPTPTLKEQITFPTNAPNPESIIPNPIQSISSPAPTQQTPIKELTIHLPQNIDMTFVYIPAGEFMMGHGKNERDITEMRTPPHKVTIYHEFYIGKYLVTQAQWRAIMGDNPSYFKEKPNNPVEQVTWYSCKLFIERLNQMDKGIFRLPSEAEWEYACRAGTTTWFYWGDDLEYKVIDKYAWFGGNSNGTTHEVGLKEPNRWCLYDMSGNIWEWCEDDWHFDYNGAPNDGNAWISYPRNIIRVIRGGCWAGDASVCRSSIRYNSPVDGNNDIGFRLARNY